MIEPVEILLVEDSPGDVRLTKEAMKESRITNNLHVVTDGVEAMNFLLKKGNYSNAVTPDLILLDLNLPKKTGFEVLTEIKGNLKLKLIPVVILTTSQAEKDIIMSYKLHGNCFISKPVEFKSFFRVISEIENFWFTIVKLPKK
jgi:CheY-like chemotaxis protein